MRCLSWALSVLVRLLPDVWHDVLSRYLLRQQLQLLPRLPQLPREQLQQPQLLQALPALAL